MDKILMDKILIDVCVLKAPAKCEYITGPFSAMFFCEYEGTCAYKVKYALTEVKNDTK